MRHHVAAAGLLLAVLLVWFHPLLGGDQLTQAHALYVNVPWASEAPPGIGDAARSGEGDAAVALEPIAKMARTSVRDGHLPLLNRSVYAGAPLLGDMQSALAFPLQWLMLPLGVSKAVGLDRPAAPADRRPRCLRARAPARRSLGRSDARRPRLHALRAQHHVGAVAARHRVRAVPLAAFGHRPRARAAGARADRRAGSRRRAVGPRGPPGDDPVVVRVRRAVPAGPAGRRAPLALASARRIRRGHLLGAVAGGIALVTFTQAYTDSIPRSVHELFARAHLPLSAGITYLLPEAFGDGKPFYDGPYLTYQLAAGYAGILILLLAGVFAI